MLLPNLLFVLVIFSLTYAQNNVDDKDIQKAIQDVFGSSFLDDYEEVTKPPLISFGALERCGEGNKTGSVCVPYYNCDPNTGTIKQNGATDGFNKIDVRANFNECEQLLDTCCKIPSGHIDNNQSGSSTNLPEYPTVRPTNRPRPPVTQATTKQPTSAVDPGDSRCGIRYPNGIDFKLTGNTHDEAEYGEFPWMMAILRRNFNPYVDKHICICGGSLITGNVVLTGAHCVNGFNPRDMKIRAGEWDTQTDRERIPYQERNVIKIIQHDQFDTENLYNDIALLILERPFVKVKSVGTICLPNPNQRISSSECFASGWGKTRFGMQGEYSVILKKIQLPTVEFNECQRLLRKTRLTPSFILHNTFTCAGGEAGKDTCKGDGGAPLVCPDPRNPGRYVQVGMVAWGIGCGQHQVPGVYTDVAKFRNWIDSHLRREGIGSDLYTV